MTSFAMNPSRGQRLLTSRSSLPFFVAALALLGLAAIYLSDFNQSTTAPSAEKAGTDDAIKPAQVDLIPGTELHRVKLTARAAQRLDIQTAQVQVALAGDGGAGRTTIPYAAVLYDADGGTWTYINLEPLVFMRHPISIDYIEQDRAVLTSGPPVGTAVVTVGAAELFGAEFGVGK